MLQIIVFGVGSLDSFTTGSTRAHCVGMSIVKNLGSAQEWVRQDQLAYQIIDLPLAQLVLATNLTSVNDAWQSLQHVTNMVPGYHSLIVIHDDLDVPQGKVKLQQRNGGSGGHNAIIRIQQMLKLEYDRIKIGISDVDVELEPVEIAELARLSMDRITQIAQSLAKGLEQLQRLATAQSRANDWWQLQRFPEAMEYLNPPQRNILFEMGPVMPVVPTHTADQLKMAVKVLYRVFESAVELIRTHPEGEFAKQVTRFIPSHLLALAQAQQSNDLSFMGMDFHSGTESGTTELTLIECNRTTGGAQDLPLVENTLEFRSYLRSQQADLLTYHVNDALESIAHSMILPNYVSDSVVCVVDSRRDDMIDWMLYSYLKSLGLPVCFVQLAELSYRSGNLQCAEQFVSVVWCLDIKSQEFATSDLYAAAVDNVVTIVPTPMVNLLTYKSFLPILANSELLKQLAGIGDKQIRELGRFVSYSEYVTPENVKLLREMISSGVSLPVKHITGGGSRASWVLNKLGVNTASILSRTASAYHSANPAILQSFAPRFEVIDSEFEFDVRAMIFIVDGELKIHWHARIYRKGDNKMLGTSPIVTSADSG